MPELTVEDFPAFGAALKDWWTVLQPEWRLDANDGEWPLSPSLPPGANNWSKLRSGGRNGMYLVVICLSWLYAPGVAAHDAEAVATSMCLINDVTLVLNQVADPALDEGELETPIESPRSCPKELPPTLAPETPAKRTRSRTKEPLSSSLPMSASDTPAKRTRSRTSKPPSSSLPTLSESSKPPSKRRRID